MDIHHYHPSTGEYLRTSAAREDPKNPGRYLVPANATDREPPTAGANEAAVFADGAWSVVPDYRDTTYWLDHEESVTIEELGVAPPEDAIYEQPNPPKPTKVEWRRRIADAADDRRRQGVRVTIDRTGYLVSTTPQAMALIAGAKIRGQEAIDRGETLMRRVPTDRGVLRMTERQLVRLFDVVDSRHEAIMGRVEQLEAKVADGTITEDDLNTGWPA